MGRPKGSKNKKGYTKHAAISKPLDASQQLINKLPTVKTSAGYEFRLTEADLEGIRDMVANGASAKYVAYQLGISEGELNVAANNSLRVKEAIQQGLAIDEAEISNKFRELAMAGNVPAAIFYQKNKHGWLDKAEQNKQGNTIINVVTGIDRTAIEPPIDADYTPLGK